MQSQAQFESLVGSIQQSLESVVSSLAKRLQQDGSNLSKENLWFLVQREAESKRAFLKGHTSDN